MKAADFSRLVHEEVELADARERRAQVRYMSTQKAQEDDATTTGARFDPLDPATWTGKERICYALGYGMADNGQPPLIDDDAPERPNGAA